MTLASSLAELWRAGDLTDVVLVPGQGPPINAHKCVLAACSGYMRAMFLGAGAHMRSSTAPMVQGVGLQMQAVELPEAAAQDLYTVLEGMYSNGNVKVHSGNLEHVLQLASFLDASAIVTACVQFCQQELCDATAAPLLVLAARYNLSHLKAQLMTYICSRFSRLLQHPTGTQQTEPPSFPHLTAALDTGLLGTSWPPRCSHQPGSSMGSLTQHDYSGAGSCGSSLGGSWGPSAAGRYMKQLHEKRQQEAAGQQRAAASLEHNSRHGQLWGTDSMITGQEAVQEVPRHLSQDPVSRRSDDGGTMHVEGEGGLAESATGCQLSQLPKDLLLEVLHSEELVVDCELDVMQLVVDWVASDLSARMSELPQLMHAVHVNNLPLPLPHSLGASSQHHTLVCTAVQQLLMPETERVQDRHLLSQQQPQQQPQQQQQPGSLQVQQAAGQMPKQHQVDLPRDLQGVGVFRNNSQPGIASNGKQSSSSVQGHGRPSRRMLPTMLLAAGGHDATWHSPKTVEFYEPSVGSWVPGPTMPQGVSFAAGALLGKDVYLVGGTPIRSCVTKLVGGGHWEPCPNLLLPRAHASLLCHAGSLFAVGGRSQVQSVQQVLASMEVCNGGGWSMGPDMATPRTALSAAALQGGLYAIGGQTTKSTLRSVERFDLGSERWHTLGAQLSSERKYGSAVVLGWRIYVVGGMDESRVKHGAVEALDPREGRWTCLAPICMPRSSAGLAALQMGPQGRLFLAGGSAPGDQVHDSVEVYMPEMDAWVAGCPLGHGRSGLALCAV